ncbi:MAG: hypothetical protein ACRD8W_23020 [Nitrososphaeraceae archaeon]
MIREDDPVVQFKLKILKKGMPVNSAVVFGDVWKVDGYYTKSILDIGCKRAVLIDSLETSTWLKIRLQYPNLDFYKGFGEVTFMKEDLRTQGIGHPQR